MSSEKSLIEIDLVFKYDNKLKKSFFIDNRNFLIFDSFFWEEVLRSWLRIIINEKKELLPQCVFNKQVFSLSFEIIDNNRISHLNQNWLKKNGPTDVLSFPIISELDNANDFFCIELGDLFISLEMAIQQSKEYKHSLKKEMLWLASHGLLHLLGWEHNNNQQLEDMLKFQEYLISEIQ